MSNYANIIHMAAHDLAALYFGTRFRTYRKTPMLQVTPQDLPILAVHILRERRVSNGQPNQAEPKFNHQLILGFSGAVHAETSDQNQLYALEETMSELDDVLLTNAKFVMLTEGFDSMDRVSQYSKVGETTLFEIRVELVCNFSSYFEPVVPDWLNKVHITVQYPDAAHVASGTPQLEQEYEFDNTG